ncbi:hypothetical protein QYF36_011218 [Acer negundo]|nr:hypothetical protein QYF36_011218 [Acer negundo]
MYTRGPYSEAAESTWRRVGCLRCLMFVPRQLIRFGRGKQPQLLCLNQKPLLGVSKFNEPGNLSRRKVNWTAFGLDTF